MWKECNVEERVVRTLRLIERCDVSALDCVLAEHDNGHARFNRLSDDVQHFIRSCLIVPVSQRPSAAQLLTSPLFARFKHLPDSPCNDFRMCDVTVRCETLENPVAEKLEDDMLSERPIDEVTFATKTTCSVNAPSMR